MPQLLLGFRIAGRHRFPVLFDCRHVIALRDGVVASENGHGDENGLHVASLQQIDPASLDAAISAK
jgi:3-deoxy-D-manno-octulosonic acid (KDO) 8-phosphate synthase